MMENQSVIELKRFFENEDEEISLNCEFDLSGYELFESKPFITPVKITGLIKNRAGIVTLSYDIRFVLRLNCDRCLDTFEREFCFSQEHILVLRLDSEDDDDFIVVEEGKLHLDELVLSDILLTLPSKLLCSEDCKGLCFKCGVNLNNSDCLCSKKEVDPRLSVLSDLLK